MACLAFLVGVAGQGADGVAAEEGVKSAPEEGATQAAVETAQGRVERAQVTTGVADREPQDSVGTLSNDVTSVSYFTELRDMSGEIVTHRWEWNGQVMTEVSLSVGGPRWRTHSSKNLDPSWIGEWTISVVDSSGRILRSDSFTYAASEAPPSVPAAVE
jgi:hypothetical protein